jgi:hypothetical protein
MPLITGGTWAVYKDDLATVSATSADNAHDGNTATGVSVYVSSDQDRAVEQDFGAAQTLTLLRVHVDVGADASIKVQYHDGGSWQDVGTTTLGTDGWFEFALSNVSANKWRAYDNALNATDPQKINEMEAYSAEEGGLRLAINLPPFSFSELMPMPRCPDPTDHVLWQRWMNDIERWLNHSFEPLFGIIDFLTQRAWQEPGLPYFAQTADKVVSLNSTGDATILSTTFQGTKTIAKNKLREGVTFEMDFDAIIDMDAGSNPTFTVRFKLGSTTVLETDNITIAAANENWQLKGHGKGTVRSSGATGRVQFEGYVMLVKVSDATDFKLYSLDNTTFTTIDTTADTDLDITVNRGTAGTGTLTNFLATMRFL